MRLYFHCEQIGVETFCYSGQVLDPKHCVFWKQIDGSPSRALETLIQANGSGCEYIVDYSSKIDLNEISDTLLSVKPLVTFKFFKSKSKKFLRNYILSYKKDFADKPEHYTGIFWLSPDYSSKSKGETSVVATDYSSKTRQWVIVDATGKIERERKTSKDGELEAILNTATKVDNEIFLVLTDSISSIEALRSGKHDEVFKGKSVCVRYTPAHISPNVLHTVADWFSRIPVD